MNVLHLLDQISLQGMPSGSVDYPNVVLTGGLQAGPGYGRRIGIALVSVKEDALLLAERFELVEGSGTKSIGADDCRAKALSLKEGGKLCRGGGLSRALQAYQHYVLLFQRNVGAAAYQVDQLLVDDID